jgi:hypothetical protein
MNSDQLQSPRRIPPSHPNKPTVGLEYGQSQLVEKVENGKMGLIIGVDIFTKRDHISRKNTNSQQQMILPFSHGLPEDVTFTNGRL